MMRGSSAAIEIKRSNTATGSDAVGGSESGTYAAAPGPNTNVGVPKAAIVGDSSPMIALERRPDLRVGHVLAETIEV